jgi:flagellar biosynthesis/type III secretory pathway protein FliH
MSAEIRAWYEDYQQQQQKLRNDARTEGRSEGLREGRNEGLVEGERKVVLRQLRARFGELPATVVARVEQAGEAELGLWAERVLAAQALADVFDVSG